MFRKALIIVPVSITCVLLLCSCSSVQVHENVDLELVNRVERLLSCCPIAEYHKVAQDLWELGPPVIPIVEDFYGCSNSKYPRPLCSMVLLAFKYGFPPNAAEAYSPGRIYNWEYPLPTCDLVFSKKVENLKQKKASDALIELLGKSSDEQTKVFVILNAIESVGNDAISPLIKALVSTMRGEKLVRFWIGVALRRIGPAAVDSLLEALRESTTAIEKYCLLGGIGIAPNKDSGAEIVAFLDYTEEFSIVSSLIPAEAARAIGVLGYGKAVVEICNVTDEVSRAFIIALGQLRSPAAIPKLSEILHNSDCQYRREDAAIALSRIGTEEAVDALKEALQKEKEKEVTEKMVLALGAIRTRSAQEVLAQFVKENRSNSTLLPYYLGQAFARIGKSSARPLIELALENTNSDYVRVLHYFMIHLWHRTETYSFAVDELWTADKRKRTLFVDLIAGTDRFALRLLIVGLKDQAPEVRERSKSILMKMTNQKGLSFDREKASAEDWLRWWKENCRYLVSPDDTTEMTQYVVNHDAKKEGKPTHWDGSMLSGKLLEELEEDIRRIEEITQQMNKLQ